MSHKHQQMIPCSNKDYRPQKKKSIDDVYEKETPRSKKSDLKRDNETFGKGKVIEMSTATCMCGL